MTIRIKSQQWLWACTPKARAVLNECIAEVEAEFPRCKEADWTPETFTADDYNFCMPKRRACMLKAAPFDPKNDGKYMLMNLQSIPEAVCEREEAPVFGLLLI